MLSPLRPASKNFRPTEGMCSYTVTATPAFASTSAAIRPAGPPPTTVAVRFVKATDASVRRRALPRATLRPN